MLSIEMKPSDDDINMHEEYFNIVLVVFEG
jgi:hypothetical protein